MTKYVDYGDEHNGDNYDLAEVFGTYSLEYQLNSGTASVQLKCPWSIRNEIANYIFEGESGWLPIEFPDQISEATRTGAMGGNALVATGMRVEPLQTSYNSDEQKIEYKYALITITYTMLCPEISIDSTNQYLTICPMGLYWDISNEKSNYTQLAQDEAPGVRLATFDVTISHPHIKMSTEDGTSIKDYEGCVNSDTAYMRYNGIEYEFPPETLLCTSPSIKAGGHLFGTGFNNISLKLSYNPLTHNMFFNPLKNVESASPRLEDHKVGIYRKTGTGTSSTDYTQVKIYPSKAFMPLFRAFGVTPINN